MTHNPRPVSYYTAWGIVGPEGIDHWETPPQHPVMYSTRDSARRTLAGAKLRGTMPKTARVVRLSVLVITED